MLNSLWKKRSAGETGMPVAPPAPAGLGGVGSSLPVVKQLTDKSTARLMESFLADLESGRFELTSMPEVAFKVRDMLADPDVEPAQLGEVINLDPVIAAKLMRTANSALYIGTTPCESVKSAVLRMGLGATRQLVLCYTMRDLFRHEAPELKAAMAAAWEQTVYVAAVCYALAQRSGSFAPEQAMLAGMVSNIGVLSVFNYLGNHPKIYRDKERLDTTVSQLRSDAGVMVLEHWEFAEDLVDCARCCRQWDRESPGDVADICDLVQVATLHALIGKQKVPQFDTVPAFRKLSSARLSPEVAIDFLREAKEEIDQAKSLING